MKNMRACRSGAFTLIELLTVIVIVGILAALTIASVRKVAALSRRSVSASNMRQIGVMAQAYSVDNKDLIAPYETVAWGASNFINLGYQYIFEYLPRQYGADGYSVFIRPGDERVLTSSAGVPLTHVGRSYARNISLPFRVGFKPTFAGNSRVDNTVRRGVMPYPSQTMFMLETQQNAGLDHAQHTQIFFDDNAPSGRCMVLFLDGHVGKLLRSDLVGASPGSAGSYTDSQRILWFGLPGVTSRQTL